MTKSTVGNPRIWNLEKVHELYEMYRDIGGFTANLLVKAVDYALDMYLDEDSTVFFAFTANLIATGLRTVISEFVYKGFVDVIFTTGGTIDHDIARSIGGRYYKGDFDVDDVALSEQGLHRLGNIFIPKEDYGPLIEKFTHSVFDEFLNVNERSITLGIRESLWHVGSKINDPNSILRAAYEKKIPIYSPGVVDSAFGTALFTFRELARTRGKKLILDVLKDMKELSEIVYSLKTVGGLVLGGGISKHHLIWWAQFTGGLKYAIYITTAYEWDGSLSGARTREAITWGKIKPRAKHVTVYGDATVIFPLFLLMLYDKLKDAGIKERKNKCFRHIINY
ncbi:MAG: deoxyhypusine synthase [Thermoprotei archaeon]|nr:MAG: deoxyhypusine synthase [Thermoprotei archaeon]